MITVLLVLQSCYTTKINTIEDISNRELEIPLRLNSFTIIDDRDSISTDFDLHIPFFTSYNHHKRKYIPPHNSNHKAIIANITERVFNGNVGTASVVDVIITIKEGGVEKYSHSGTLISEWATVEMKTEIVGMTGKVSSTMTVTEAINNMWNGPGAKKDMKSRVDELYVLTLKNATYRSLEYIKEYMIEEGVIKK
ncbi:hypothetical protein [Lewinella sp. LCG006]|uniref:hypothetical protein n=1 Tax=Lewinella sp. LCG006 TaxID=3231911 RepID=UPI00346053AF